MTSDGGARQATNEELVKLARSLPWELSSLPQLAMIESEIRRRSVLFLSDDARSVRSLMNAIEDEVNRP